MDPVTPAPVATRPSAPGGAAPSTGESYALLNRIANFFVRMVERWVPDPFVFCALMTLIVFVLSAWLTPTRPRQLMDMWYDGLWSILAFTMQVVLLLLTGYTLAVAPPIRRVVERLVSVPKSQGAAVVLLLVLGTMGYMVHWGFTTVSVAVLARSIARKVPHCDFRFLIAAVYSSSVVGNSGFGSTIPIVTATAGNQMNFIERYTGHAISVTQTVLSPMNLVLLIGALVGLPVLFLLMMPRGNQIRSVDPALLADPVPVDPALGAERTPAKRLEDSRLILMIVVIFGGWFIFDRLLTQRFAVDFNTMTLVGLTLGMALHGRPSSYIRAFNEATRLVGPITLQFPFYGGIMGLMTGSGLAVLMSNWFVSVSNDVTLPFLAFVAALLISFAIPSASGHWIVQGPVFVPAALNLGVDPAAIAVAVSAGDGIACMVQPFWALPILALANLSIRDIMGYCVITFAYATVLATIGLFFLS